MSTRTRQVYPTKEVMHLWVNHSQESARNPGNNVYFREPEVIYSYGSHFPMARHFTTPAGNAVVFVTKQGYSNTTRKHMSWLRRAIWQEEVMCVFIPVGPMDECMHTHDKNYQWWANEIEDALTKLARARKKELHTERIDDLRREANRYSAVTGVRIPEELYTKIYAADITAFQEAARQEQTLRRERLEREMAEGMYLYRSNVDAWHNDMDAEWRRDLSAADKDIIRKIDQHLNETWLRIRNGQLETSQGIHVSLPVAERYYHRYIEVVAKGGCNSEGDCGEYKMAGFDVRSMNADMLIVGCHRIPRTEIDYIANKLNWNTNATIHP